MALRDVRDFVRQYASQFRLALRGEDQPRVHPDIAAGHREGVDARIGDREEGEAETGIVADRDQPVAELVEVGFDIRVIEVGRLTPANLVHDLLADPFLGRQRQLAARHIPQLRQFIRIGRRRCEDDGHQGGGEATKRRHGAMIYDRCAPPSGRVVTNRNRP